MSAPNPQTPALARLCAALALLALAVPILVYAGAFMIPAFTPRDPWEELSLLLVAIATVPYALLGALTCWWISRRLQQIEENGLLEILIIITAVIALGWSGYLVTMV